MLRSKPRQPGSERAGLLGPAEDNSANFHSSYHGIRLGGLAEADRKFNEGCQIGINIGCHFVQARYFIALEEASLGKLTHVRGI